VLTEGTFTHSLKFFNPSILGIYESSTKNKCIVKKNIFYKMLFQNPVPFDTHLRITTQPNVY